MKFRAIFAWGACVLSLPLTGQNSAAAEAPHRTVGTIEAHRDWPAANNDRDVDTPEHLVTALEDVISGPAGKARDWDRFRALFLPDARLATVRLATPSENTPPTVTGDVVYMTPDGYIERNDPYFKTNSFFERSIANRSEQFGNLIDVWSTFESRHAPSDINPFSRGINSIQVVRAQGRYWIASIVWEDERPGVVLPDKYLR